MADEMFARGESREAVADHFEMSITTLINRYNEIGRDVPYTNRSLACE